MALTIDGSGTNGTTTTGPATAWTLNPISTSLLNDIILVFSAPGSGSNQIASVSDTAGLTWHSRSNGAASGVQMYWALAASALSGDVITVTYAASESAAVVGAIAINGANTSSPFDPNITTSLTSGFGGTVSGITTTNANDMLVGFYNNSGGLTASSPFTMIFNNDGMFATYDVVSV